MARDALHAAIARGARVDDVYEASAGNGWDAVEYIGRYGSYEAGLCAVKMAKASGMDAVVDAIASLALDPDVRVAAIEAGVRPKDVEI